MHRVLMTLALTALVALISFAAPAAAQNLNTYEVTITNLTYNQIIANPVIATHTFRTRIFTSGTPASDELAAVAEDADASGLLAALEGNEQVLDAVVAAGPLLPGESVTVEVRAGGRYSRLSAVGMLVTTNDAFFGLSNYIVTGGPSVQRVSVPAYDSGTEANTELCESIPGPPCGNAFVRDLDGAEGFVHIHRGMHGVGDLSAAAYDWRNPVVRITAVRK